MKCPCPLVLLPGEDPCLECLGGDETKSDKIGKQRANARLNEVRRDERTGNIRRTPHHIHTRM